jgi:hypothetical protein
MSIRMLQTSEYIYCSHSVDATRCRYLLRCTHSTWRFFTWQWAKIWAGLSKTWHQECGWTWNGHIPVLGDVDVNLLGRT